MKRRGTAAVAATWIAAAVCAGPAATAVVTAGAAAAVLARPSSAEARTIRVTSNADSGKGSLRAAIEEANAAASSSGETTQIDVAIGNRVLVAASALPDLIAPGTVLDGGDATIRQGQGCLRPGGRKGCDGIAVSGPNITVRRLRIAGFDFDGVSVRGHDARDVRVEDVHAIDNLDDGIGISAGAGPVVIERCLLMGNGYRTKGKGVLVFDDSRATITNSVAVGNRDGISITRRAGAKLEDVWIVGSFDKGLGVSGGRVSGKGVRIIANGDGIGFDEKPPNADGLRVGLTGKAELSAARIEGNGDAGVIALESSSIVLHGSTIRANRGFGIVCDADARVRADGTTIDSNHRGNVFARSAGRVTLVTPPPSGQSDRGSPP